MFLDYFDEEAICLAKAAEIIRREIKGVGSTFEGTFPQGCQEKSVSKSLLAMTSMILDGPNISKKN